MPARVIPATPGHLITAELWFRNKYYRTFKSVMYYTKTGGTVPTFAQVSSFAEDMFNTSGGEFDDLLDHECYFTQVIARFENLEGVDIVGMSTSDAIAGAKGTLLEDGSEEIESLPPEASINIRKFTDKKGRQNTGRLFIPFVSEAVQHDGIIDLLNYTTVRQAITTLMVPPTMGGAVLNPVHWNRKEAKLVPILRMGGAQFISERRDRRFKEKNLYVLP